MNTNIDIKSIRKIIETYNPLSSPAASIDRLEIFYNKFDSILISPKDKKEIGPGQTKKEKKKPHNNKEQK